MYQITAQRASPIQKEMGWSNLIHQWQVQFPPDDVIICRDFRLEIQCPILALYAKISHQWVWIVYEVHIYCPFIRWLICPPSRYSKRYICLYKKLDSVTPYEVHIYCPFIRWLICPPSRYSKRYICLSKKLDSVPLFIYTSDWGRLFGLLNQRIRFWHALRFVIKWKVHRIIS